MATSRKKKKTYDKIDRPYNDNLSRKPEEPTKASVSEAKPAPMELTSGGNLFDVWLESWLKSRNYKAGATGFYLDGRDGTANFSRVVVQSRTNLPALDVRKWEGDGVGINIQSYGDTGLYVRQESDTPAAKFFTTSLSGANGATIEATNEADSGVVGSLKQDGTGNVLYLQRTNPETGETAFYPQILMSGGPYTNLIKFWTSDGTDPEGDLSGSAGDFCFGTDGNAHICQGGTSWNQIGTSGMELLADVQLSGVATSIDSGTIPARSWLTIKIHFTDPLGNPVIPKLHFNSDSGNNYNFYLTEITGTSQNANATGIELWKTASTAGAHFSFSVCNYTSEWKIVTGTGFKQNNVHIFGGGSWENTSDQITSVKVDTGAINMNIGSRLTVYGSSF